MPAKCASPETVILNREIRETIGRRLREHYDLAQRVPLPARLAELAKQFGQPIEPTESNHQRTHQPRKKHVERTSAAGSRLIGQQQSKLCGPP